MSTVSEVMAGISAAQNRGAESAGTSNVSNASEAANAAGASKTSRVGGRTIGNPQLSENAVKYYEELRRKNPNMEFILVSSDQKEMAKAQAASYGNPHRMVVLIDEEKIERMAVDENYRKQYEGIIANGANQLKQLAQKLSASGAKVKSYGMQVKDNRASFFAAVDKGFRDQRKRIEERRAEKKEARKAEAKKEAKRAAEERRQERAEGRRAERAEDEDVEILSADSIDELMQKVDDYVYAGMSDRVWTEEEKMVGQHVDFSL